MSHLDTSGKEMYSLCQVFKGYLHQKKNHDGFTLMIYHLVRLFLVYMERNEFGRLLAGP